MALSTPSSGTPAKKGKSSSKLRSWDGRIRKLSLNLFSETHTDLPFHMQTRGMLTHEALLVLLKPKREWLSETRRAEIALKQASVCFSCNEKLGKDFEIDHSQPLASFGDNDPGNLVAICAACHSQKSQLESLTRLEPDPITSEFSPDVYESFVKSPSPIKCTSM